MKQTNVNILRGRQRLKYGIEYVPSEASIQLEEIKWKYVESQLCDTVQFTVSAKHVNCSRYTNSWVIATGDTGSASHIPEHPKLARFNLYFPSHSVETYENNNLYMIEFSTYINGDRIILGCFLIDRRDALAFPGSKSMLGERYCEYTSVIVPDPWAIAYSDEWSEFRKVVCGEPANINNTGSLVNIELCPVKCDDNLYIKTDGFTGGSNSVLIGDSSVYYLSPMISIRESDDPVESPSVYIDMKYNSEYDSVEEYIRETYQIEDDTIDARTSVILHDGENVYNWYAHLGIFESLRLDLWSDPQIIRFDSWTGTDEEGNETEYWKPGLMFTAYFTIYRDDEPAVSVTSQNFPLTQEAFSILVKRPSGVPSKIDTVALDASHAFDIIIDNIPMTDVNIVNKIVKNVVSVQKPTEYKSNITRAVFVRVRDNGQDIEVHPSVTENIGIDLQKYKNTVKRFTLSIDGSEFPEIGRTGSNVVFKIPAGSLSDHLTAGKYYILDDNKELVTNGNYSV